MTCPGSLRFHVDGTVAACTEDDERDACCGRELRHEGDPQRCFEWWPDGRDRCDASGV